MLPPAGQLLQHLAGDEVTGQLQVAEVGGEPVHHHHCYHDHLEDTLHLFWMSLSSISMLGIMRPEISGRRLTMAHSRLSCAIMRHFLLTIEYLHQSGVSILAVDQSQSLELPTNIREVGSCTITGSFSIVLNSVLNVKVVSSAFNQEKVLLEWGPSL